MPKRSAAPVITTDIAIVGGGLAGGLLAALLGRYGLNVVCIDRDDPAATLLPGFDGRTTAISHGSQKVVAAAGVWDELAPGACPIEAIDISQEGAAPVLTLDAGEVAAEAFGWIVENRAFRAAIYRRLNGLKNVRHLAPVQVTGIMPGDTNVEITLGDGRTIRASLLVGADGKNSSVRDFLGIATRGWSYRQTAIACVVRHERPHLNRAVEDFRGDGPFAILPMTDDANGRHRSSIVWTQHGVARSPVSPRDWDEKTFNAALATLFPRIYGAVELAGPRFAYPLGLSHAQTYIAPRAALIADAAHAIHPIAGQGLNMGLRDVAALAELVVNAKTAGRDLGSPDLLAAYQRQRRFDTMAMAASTDMLNRLFVSQLLPARIARRLGLNALGRLPRAKKFLIEQAMGVSGHLPLLIREGSL